MITSYEIDRDGKRYWIASGSGIIAEGSTRAEARKYWHQQYQTRAERNGAHRAIQRDSGA